MSVGQVCAVVVLAAIACGPDLRAQGLGAAAARAAEERKAAEGKTAVKFTEKDLPAADKLENELRDFLLTEELFWKYVSARAWLLELREKSPNLDRYLLNAERAGTDPLTIEAMMIEERAILECLDRELIAPRAYTLTEVAYHRALADAARSDVDMDRLPPTRAANARFLRTHEIQISNAVSHQWGKKEKWRNRAAGSRGQNLGEAATKAREEPRSRATIALSDRDFAATRYWEITAAGLERYASIRAELTAHRRARPDLHTRLFDASRTISRLSEMERHLAREPIVVFVLNKYNLTPREYLRMDQAILTATYWSSRDTPRALRRQLIHMANIRFLREQSRIVREQKERYRGDQWYDESRFIEQF